MKVKVTAHRYCDEFGDFYDRGVVKDVPDDHAKKLIERGVCVPLEDGDAPAEAPKTTRKKKTTAKKATRKKTRKKAGRRK